MSGTVEKIINGDRIQVQTPDADELAHITRFGTCRDNVEAALKIYLADKQAFFITKIEDRAIEGLNKNWAESSKELCRVAMGFFRMHNASEEDKEYVNGILDKITKDNDLRKQNMQQHCDFLLKKDPLDTELGKQMRRIMLDCTHTLQCFMNCQSQYIGYYEKGTTFESPIQKAEAEGAYEAEKIRNAVPEGCTYRPSYIYPKQPEIGRAHV